jgi:uncharacterized protein
MMSAPSGFGQALCALDLHLGPTPEVAIVGHRGDAATRALVEEVTRERWRPNLVLAVTEPGSGADREIPLLADRAQVDRRATAYVCRRFVCQLPVTDPTELRRSLP